MKNEMYVIAFIFGTIFGSLGSVLLSRLEEKVDWKIIKGILFGFSKCPHCKNRLQAQHLIPLVSFFWQNGKCAFCKKSISRQYPIMEIASGLVFMFSYYLVEGTGGLLEGLHRTPLIFWIFTNRGLLLLIIQDIKTQELHMPMRIFTVLRVLGRQFLGIVGDYQGAVIASLVFALVTGIIYLGAKIYVKWKYHSNQEGFGQGDIYLGFLLGALFPFVEQVHALPISLITHIEIVIAVFLLASVLGLIYALLIGIIDKKTSIKINGRDKLTIPFFPTLILAYWIMLLWGDVIFSYFFL